MDHLARFLTAGTAFFFSLMLLQAEEDEGDEDFGSGAKSVHISAVISLGYESNVFEVDSSQGPTTADWFSASKFQLAAPLGAGFTAKFLETGKQYFRQSGIDEYLLRPALDWQLGRSEPTNFTLEAHGGRFRERIFGQFQRAPDQSQAGWTGGGGSRLESKLTEMMNLIWKTGADYQRFDNVDQNNVHLSTEAKLEISPGPDRKFMLGAKCEFQRYATRPPEDEGVNNPPGLRTLEARGVVGYEKDLPHHCFLETEINAGRNFDLTNGYYNAGVVAGRVELRWEPGKWKIKVAAEPELVVFGKRPANFERPATKLLTQEYVFQAILEYNFTVHLAFRVSDSLHLQLTNSDDSQADSTLNRFLDNVVAAGVSISF